MHTSLIDHFRFPSSLVFDAPEWNDNNGLAGRCGASSPPEMLRNLRLELYPKAVAAKAKLSSEDKTRAFYYRIRPFLTVAVRKWVQRAYLSNWRRITFPQWPVDFTADDILERSLALAMRRNGLDTLPFIWFWPQGNSSCVVITHDVESESGHDFVPELMDLDDAYGVKSSFQLIPENRYRVSQDFIDTVRQRGFEINVHDLKHDGSLFGSREEFARQAHRINEYGRRWQALGFRTGSLYRREEWFDLLQFEYDMSVPVVASLDPQRGGCCTVFPYFIGNMLEFPVTLTQDYTLFHVLGEYSVDVWRRQIDIISARHGLVHLIVHPDYVRDTRGLRVYEQLLRLLSELRQAHQLFCSLPRDLNRWWRARRDTELVQSGSQWTTAGPAADKATIALARLKNERLVFEVAPSIQIATVA